MLSAASLGLAALSGLEAGLRFNLYFALGASALAAGVSGYPRAPRSHGWWSVAILVAGWAAGDGVNLALSVSGNPGMFAGQAAPWAHLAVQALAGAAFGYALPALTGAYVGRLVHRGTGYLSAAVVAATMVPALAAVGTSVAALLGRLAA